MATRRRKTAPQPQPTGTSDQIDRELAAAALRKRQLGEAPTRQELAALRRIELATEERRRREYFATCSKRHYREFSGRQTKILHDQAALYGIPISQPTVDLAAVIRWLHDFLADNRQKLQATDGEDPMSGESTPALERWREEKWRLARLERQRVEQSQLPRDEIHELLGRVAGILRAMGDRLQRRFGPEAYNMLTEALDDADRHVATYFQTNRNQPDDKQPD